MASLLLVADDDWVRNDVAAAFSDPGSTVRSIDDPEEAAEVLAEGGFDVVIVDLQVKSMGGMAITRMLHDAIAMGEADETPIVMLLDRQADTFLARRAGADGHLVKPFTSQQLRALMAEFQPAGG
jgi:DNA-binding response OmpR family regulator